MRQTTIATLALTAMLSLAACQQKQTATPAAATTPETAAQAAAASQLTPEQLGELGALISNTPDRASELLAQHNMTRESFEKAIRAVTEDVDASKRYAAAYKRTAA